MSKIYIGTGGWQYFNSEGDPLINYAKIFDFCEINTTFYKIPNEEICKLWRKKVEFNKNFIFSVKAYKEITHTYLLKPISKNLELFDKLERICNILNSDMIVFQTPNEFKFDDKIIQDINEFFTSIENNKFTYIWEIRGVNQKNTKIFQKIKKLLQNHKIVHCVDICKEKEPIKSNNKTFYSRIFGKGISNKYQFDDNEIKTLNNKFRKYSNYFDRVVISFHTQRMVHDAARAKYYNDTGKFLSATGKIGIDSIILGIDEYNKYPISKHELIIQHGWKLFDKDKNTRIKMNKILQKLPEKLYNNRLELISEIKKLYFD